MHQKRPVFLQPTQIWLPITAISSILHRISGVFLVLLFPFCLSLLSESLHSAASFEVLRERLSGFFPTLFLWVALSALAYHFIAGIRHLLMDLGFGETLSGGRFGAKLVMALSAVAVITLGVWLW